MHASLAGEVRVHMCTSRPGTNAPCLPRARPESDYGRGEERYDRIARFNREHRRSRGPIEQRSDGETFNGSENTLGRRRTRLSQGAIVRRSALGQDRFGVSAASGHLAFLLGVSRGMQAHHRAQDRAQLQEDQKNR